MEEPPSPGVRPVELKDCMEELLRFTLISSIQRKIQTGLSDQYCAHFLQHDPPAPIHTHAVPGGVPPYPLYKQLASSLYQSLLGALYTSKSELVPAHENLNLRKIDGECYKMIMEKGPILLSTLKEVNFELHVQEPFFSLLSDGVKTIEGRCAVGDYRRIQEGHVLIFNKCLTLQVQDVRHYSSFREMLELESLASVLPGVTSIEEGVQICRNFYSRKGKIEWCSCYMCSKTNFSASCYSGQHTFRTELWWCSETSGLRRDCGNKSRTTYSTT